MRKAKQTVTISRERTAIHLLEDLVRRGHVLADALFYELRDDQLRVGDLNDRVEPITQILKDDLLRVEQKAIDAGLLDTDGNALLAVTGKP